MFCLGVCLFVCLYPINVKTVEPIRTPIMLCVKSHLWTINIEEKSKKIVKMYLFFEMHQSERKQLLKIIFNGRQSNS